MGDQPLDVSQPQDMAGSGHDGGRRHVAAQACDACRISKTKCQMSTGSSMDTPRSLDQRSPASTRSPNPTLSTCTRCFHTGKKCTFLMPVGNRGPRKRPRVSSSVQQLDSEATNISAFANILNEPLPTASAVREVARDTSDGLRSLDDGSLEGYYPSPNTRFEPSSGAQLGALNHRITTLCSRTHLLRIMEDYLQYLYPLIPIIHQPSFRRDLRLDRDVNDPDFLTVVVAICASVVAILSSTYSDYLYDGESVRFESRGQMVNCCADLITSLRSPNYYEKVTHRKWAVAYLMATAFYHTGEYNRAQMMSVEAMQLARFLGLHDHSTYSGLDFIEVQLRKKAFWLTFYTFAHAQLQDVRAELLSYLDGRNLSLLNIEDLMPLNIDDEYISEDKIILSSPTTLHMTEGFNLTSRVFWASLTSLPRPDGSIGRESYPQILSNSNYQEQAVFLRDRARQVKYMLDDAPKYLQQWVRKANSGLEEDQTSSLRKQIEIVRSNLHLTHLWIQSVLYDHLLVLRSKLPPDNQICNDDFLWNEREDISKQLLHVVHSIDPEYLLSNGYLLIYKVRDVAGSLFTCPFAPSDERSLRANKYLRDFAEILSHFDNGDRPNHLSQRGPWFDNAAWPQSSDDLTPC